MTAAEVLEAARQDRKMSYDAVRLAVYDRLGAFSPTMETVRTYHRNDGPKRIDLTVLMAIADVYGLTLSDLGLEAPKELRDLVIRASRWNVETAAPVAA
jgi:hypothetical protein